MIKVNSLVKSATKKYISAAQTVSAALRSPSKAHGQMFLFAFGVALLGIGISMGLEAQGTRTIEYNDQRVVESVNGVLLYLEGSFGALVMVASGIGAILSAAFGQYRAALGLMVVAIGAFILRSLMSTFFNDDNIQE